METGRFNAGWMALELDTSAACEAGAEGWQYTQGPDTKIRLCGRVCDTIRGDVNGRVDVVLGCPVVLL